jgi:hypothetical protein
MGASENCIQFVAGSQVRFGGKMIWAVLAFLVGLVVGAAAVAFLVWYGNGGATWD